MAGNSPNGFKNAVGKVRNCSSRAISPFPIVFSKDFYYRCVKTRACFGKASKSYIFVTYLTLYEAFEKQNNLPFPKRQILDSSK